MRIGVSTAAYYGRIETEDAAQRLAALGVPCCEAFLQTFSEYNAAYGRLLKARLGSVQTVSIHAKTQHFEGDIFGRSPRQVEDAFALMTGTLDAGQALGAHIYVYHGPACIRVANPDLGRWQEAIDRAIDLGLSRGIRLCWETVSWCYLTSPGRARAFAQRWPRLGFVIDTKQISEMGQDPLDYLDAMGDALHHVHVLDHDADGRLTLPGKGVTDFAGLARALRAGGYAGDIILEPYADLVPDDGALMDSLHWLEDVFGAEVRHELA